MHGYWKGESVNKHATPIPYPVSNNTNRYCMSTPPDNSDVLLLCFCLQVFSVGLSPVARDMFCFVMHYIVHILLPFSWHLPLSWASSPWPAPCPTRARSLRPNTTTAEEDAMEVEDLEVVDLEVEDTEDITEVDTEEAMAAASEEADSEAADSEEAVTEVTEVATGKLPLGSLLLL